MTRSVAGSWHTDDTDGSAARSAAQWSRLTRTSTVPATLLKCRTACDMAKIEMKRSRFKGLSVSVAAVAGVACHSSDRTPRGRCVALHCSSDFQEERHAYLCLLFLLSIHAAMSWILEPVALSI
jgi:hypothetical protein